MAKFAHRFRDQTEPIADFPRIFERRMPRQRTDLDSAALKSDKAQRGQSVDVDQDRGRHNAEIHHRHEALPAREQPRLAAMLAQRGHQFLFAARLEITERGGLHDAAPYTCRQIAVGITGSVSIVARVACSASSTALAIAAGADIAQFSPTPLLPN